MTKELGTSLLRIGTALVVMVAAVHIYVAAHEATDQLVWQGLLFIAGFGLLVQGIVGLVTRRRR
ncbi:hypothetical protein [Kutzneria buriramensis]|uniref:Uncharacterized protein n=1 Tax=Kutzneria buriramensis TaxID=1045776 RepID=A0A3E0I525_9PSEU|nr:hypothetical protein [Kutzneria buriramensis]REH53842.1 hypothetical protein BCF44_10263 [Kutzneria buriramensis]